MSTRSRLPGRVGRRGPAVAAALLLPLTSLLGYHAVASALDDPRPTRLVDVDGRALHLRCTGEATAGAPTVVLDAASGGVAASWAWVQADLAADHRVCSWDRPGLGYSEGPVLDLEATATALHEVLADEQGPFVLVGHSLGALVVRELQAQHPDSVAGMVLVDGAHPEQLERLPALRERQASGETELRSLVWAGRTGVLRAFMDLGGRLDFASLPSAAREEVEALWSTAPHLAGMLDEHRAAPSWMAEATDLPSLGDLPLAVVSAGEGFFAGWDDLQDELAALSTRSRHVEISGSTHMSLVLDQDDAQVTADTIRDLAARAAR